MKKFITKVRKFELSDSFEIRCYERGIWQHDCYVNDIEEAIERMNHLMQEYEYKADEVELIKISYYENITEEMPF